MLIRIVLFIVLLISAFISGFFLNKIQIVNNTLSNKLLTPLGKPDRPLDAYTIDNLGKRPYRESRIVLDTAIATTSSYTTYLFHFLSDEKKVTGIVNAPDGEGKFPVILQVRGYVDREKFTSGEGTKRSGLVFADNGFLTIAPDFLGYGGSDMPSNDVFEERFQTYTTVLNLLASLKSLPNADTSRVSLWAHSNGGQIALTVKEILASASGELANYSAIPLTLWAPVTKPFPYSILYYTDDSPDYGKSLRKSLAGFEQIYNPDLYAMTFYLDRLEGPIQLHQGLSDEAVPYKWSDDFVYKLNILNKNIKYYKYPDAGHNMEGSWSDVVQKDIEFFKKSFR